MRGENKCYCWEIMQCDDKDACPVRAQKIDRCWDWMNRHSQFQSQYGLCPECIVYLAQNDNTILAADEVELIMISRGLYQDDAAAPACGRSRAS